MVSIHVYVYVKERLMRQLQAQGHLQGYKTGMQVKPLGQREGEEDFIELKEQELI